MILVSEMRSMHIECLHPQMLLVDEASSTLQCPYHGRTLIRREYEIDARARPDRRLSDCSRQSQNIPFYILEGIDFQLPRAIRFGCLKEMEARIGWMPIEKFEYDHSRNRYHESGQIGPCTLITTWRASTSLFTMTSIMFWTTMIIELRFSTVEC